MKVSKNIRCEFSHGITKKEFIALPEMKKTRSWIVWAGIIEGLVCALNMPLIIFVENLADNQTINPMMLIVILFAPMLCTIELFQKPQSTAKVFAIGAVELVMAVIALVSGMCYALWLGFVSGPLAIIGAARINKRWKQYCSRSEAETAAEAEQAPEKNSQDLAAEQVPEKNQPSLVQEIHSEEGDDGWIQYDILYPFGYGWDNMISAADNIIAADFSKIEKITYGYSPYESIDITADFENNGCKCKGLTSLEDEEGSNIAIFGISRRLQIPVKLVWFNQTSFVRVITIPVWSETVIREYGETVIGKSFGIKEEVPDVKTENCGTAADDKQQKDKERYDMFIKTDGKLPDEFSAEENTIYKNLREETKVYDGDSGDNCRAFCVKLKDDCDFHSALDKIIRWKKAHLSIDDKYLSEGNEFEYKGLTMLLSSEKPELTEAEISQLKAEKMTICWPVGNNSYYDWLDGVIYSFNYSTYWGSADDAATYASWDKEIIASGETAFRLLQYALSNADKDFVVKFKVFTENNKLCQLLKDHDEHIEKSCDVPGGCMVKFDDGIWLYCYEDRKIASCMTDSWYFNFDKYLKEKKNII